eukprot:10297242-Alexandrium_andersonii.AAC.1
MAFHEDGHGHADAKVLLGAQGRPQVQVVDELYQLVRGCVAQQRRPALGHEAALDAVALRRRFVLLG